ncbi:50S ribosomal protein L18 [candidate division TA06 bacterium]|uniref:Large ribosomal subunit protein uL18 n=1 Tax=candidate division TA06 bacterium TaxID=2250710 RepID=A0A933I7E1_UNCT6|nr:50S ribosomal protein L18 [candidate division TA06 bacterium]
MADKAKEKRDARLRRHVRIRRKVQGTSERPRLCVFRSNKFIYAQVIDDTQHAVLAASGKMEGLEKGKLAQSKQVGKKIAQLALAKGIKQVVFDRGGYIYHGRIKALAESAREAGLQF